LKTEKPPTAASQRWRYYPEIDGLRAVAVLAVFFFHLSPNILRGGFVGVDTFFVISGYLISSVLLQDMDQRKFSILRFYQHRIARIAPSLFLVLLVTLFAGWLIYSAQDFASLGANAAFAAISAINIKLISQGTYFQISPDAQPLIHYWTLSVEEQFYLLFPFYLYLVVKSRHATVVTALLCAASFALCVVLTNSQPEFSFYMLPTRAWELLAGAMLALLQRSNFELRTLSASAAGPIGVVILAISVFTIQGGQSFPGWIAAFPCLGSFLILLSVQKQAGFVSRMLSAPFAVFIGSAHMLFISGIGLYSHLSIIPCFSLQRFCARL
jgi:peptidoglycan/LPS O-acetylase OafA/YrhL